MKAILIYIFTITFFAAKSQNITFTYDNAGNRISKSSSQTPTSRMSQGILNDTLNQLDSEREMHFYKNIERNAVNRASSKLNDAKNDYEVTLYPDYLNYKVLIILNRKFLQDSTGKIEILNIKAGSVLSSPANVGQTSLDLSFLAIGDYKLVIFSGNYKQEWKIKIE